MFFLTKPSDEKIRDFLRAQSESPFSYREVGVSRTGAPSGYTEDKHRVLLGYGEKIFEKAKRAVREWKIFPRPWVRIDPPAISIQPGETVAISVRAACGWWLNACRIVYVLEEKASVEKFGFAYGTLRGHAEIGEERFVVQWEHRDDSVWYELSAFSRPGRWVTRLGRFWVRRLQRRFQRDSIRSLRDFLRTPENTDVPAEKTTLVQRNPLG